MSVGCSLCDRKSLLIYPVRYAVACPRGAAKAPALTGNFKIDARAPQSVATAKYTLRALRAGYLYTFDEKRRRLRAYMVLPDGLMWSFVPGHQPPPENSIRRAATGCATIGDMAFLSLGRCVDVEHTPGVDEATNLWVGWSNVAWTKALVEKAVGADGATWRAQHMQCIDVKSMIAGSAAHSGEFQANRSYIASFAMDNQALKDAFDFSNTPPAEERRLHDLADRIGGAMAQTPIKKGFVVAINDPVGITNDLAELTVPSMHNGFDTEIYWKYMSTQLLQRAELGTRANAEAEAGLIYGTSKAIADANVANMAAHAPIAPDPVGLYQFVRSWVKTGSADEAAKIEQKKIDDLPATRQAAGDQAWNEASLKMGPDGKPVIGPDGKPVSLVDTKAVDHFLQHEYPQALDAFKPKWDPLVRAHADWLKSDLLADWMAGNHDAEDLRSGYAYSESCAQAIGVAAGTEACQKVLDDWLSSAQVSGTRHLYTRALMFNQKALMAAADSHVSGSDIQYENFLNVYKDAVTRVEKLGDQACLRDRLVFTTANTIVKVLTKGLRGPAVGFVTIRLSMQAGVRIKAANITPIEMQKWMLAEGRARGLKLDGNRVQQRAAAAEISRTVLTANPSSNPEAFKFAIDTDAWVEKGTIDAGDIKVIKIPGVETTRKWLSSASSTEFNMGVTTAIFQLATLTFAGKDLLRSDQFNERENLLKVLGAFTSILGNIVEKVCETVAKSPNHPLAAFLTKQWAWLSHSRAEGGVWFGKFAGGAAGFALASYDLFINAPEAFKNYQYGLGWLYMSSGSLAAYVALSPLFLLLPEVITAWFPPVGIVFFASIAVGVIIPKFKPAAISGWVPKSKFGREGEHYRSLDDELSAFNSAMGG